jgi:hypothetical protein
MQELFCEDIRCFRGKHSAPIAPITVLVGENSTGKSTFLALARLAWGLLSSEEFIDFNEEPFLLGSFDQIAAFRTGTGGRAASFRLGHVVSVGPMPVTVSGTFESLRGQPTLREWLLEFDERRSRVTIAAAEAGYALRARQTIDVSFALGYVTVGITV